MFSKKFLVFLLSLIVLAAFSFGAFAASGQGYFGSGNGDNYQLEDEDDYDDYDDEDDYDDDDDYVTVPSTPPENNSNNKYEVPTNQELTYWEKRNITPEQRSVNSAKVIESYQLDRNVARDLLNKHRDAEKTQVGKREQAQRYEIIFGEYPYDYFAAYKVAELHYDMGHYGTALKWVDISLKVYPNYYPASALRKKASGALKR